jgi:hypothetical protein
MTMPHKHVSFPAKLTKTTVETKSGFSVMGFLSTTVFQVTLVHLGFSFCQTFCSVEKPKSHGIVFQKLPVKIAELVTVQDLKITCVMDTKLAMVGSIRVSIKLMSALSTN